MRRQEDSSGEVDWAERAKNLLKAELRRRGMTYHDLIAALATVGIEDNHRNLVNKISRGQFSAVFLLQCLTVIGVKELHLDPL